MIGLVRHLLDQDEAATQAVAVEGVAKLMLAGMIADQQVSAGQFWMNATTIGLV